MGAMAGRLVSVNVGAPTSASWADADDGRSGIDKRPAAGPVRVAPAGVVGDFIGNLRVHGGADQAAYAYAREDAAWWERELGHEIRPGAFGENLSTQGVDVTGAVIGERWAAGTALLEVSMPRTPCTVFAGFWDVPDLIKRFTAHGAPGAYLRVVRAGVVTAGDPVEVVDRPAHGVTIGTTFRALNGEPELLPALLAATQLPKAVRDKVHRRLTGAVRP